MRLIATLVVVIMAQPALAGGMKAQCHNGGGKPGEKDSVGARPEGNDMVSGIAEDAKPQAKQKPAASKQQRLEALMARIDKRIEVVSTKLQNGGSNAQQLETWKARLLEAKERLAKKLAKLQSGNVDSYIGANASQLGNGMGGMGQTLMDRSPASSTTQPEATPVDSNSTGSTVTSQ